jgi:hypothetical protein
MQSPGIHASAVLGPDLPHDKISLSQRMGLGKIEDRLEGDPVTDLF